MNLWIDELIDTFEATAFYNGDEPIKTESDSFVLDNIKSSSVLIVLTIIIIKIYFLLTDFFFN